jgi:hypothetical protein
MRWNVRVGTILGTLLVPTAAWATEATLPLGAVFLGGAGAAAVGFAGFVCLRLYAVLKGGDLGAAWQTVAYALLFLAVALVLETVVSAGWLTVPTYVTGLLKLLGAAGLVMSFLRFAKVFK